VVGINPLPFSDPDYFVGASAAAGEQYGHALAAFALWLIERGYGILFFPTQLRADPPAIEEVLASMARSRSVDVRDRVIGFSVQSLDELLSAISMTDIVVATRYHAVVISHVLNRPVLGIAYAEKTTALMEQMGQSEFAVDIARCGIATLQERFIVLEARKAVAKRILAQRVCASRAALDAQYEAVGRLLHGGSG
jgi:polysaccharide pyruvyl transferase WcaK-like protein